MKYLKVVFLTVILVSIMCITAYATDVGITDLTYHDTDTVINMFKADGTAVTADSNGVFLGAERFTLNYSAASPGYQYVIFVLSDNSGIPTESNILYIDQVFAAGSIISFDVYPKNITSGGTVYISGGATGMKKLASYEYFDLTNAFTVSLSNETVASGESVSVDVNLSNNPGIGGIQLFVYYDTSILTYSSYSTGEVWNSHVSPSKLVDVNKTKESLIGNGIGNVNGIDEDIIAISMLTLDDISANGTLLTLSFNVVPVSQQTVTNIILFSKETVNNDGNYIFTATENGTVTIVLYILGDISGDNEITIKDALYALQMSVGKPGFTDLQRLAGDVTRDGEVTVKDALKILQYTVGRITSFD